jgi:hypothetical protein
MRALQLAGCCLRPVRPNHTEGNNVGAQCPGAGAAKAATHSILPAAIKKLAGVARSLSSTSPSGMTPSRLS